MDDDLKNNRLWATFLEATSQPADGGFAHRVQWMIFPPCIAEFGGDPGHAGYGRYIKRRFTRAGHKPKWETKTAPTAEDTTRLISAALEQYESMGWVLRQPILIELEQDDYAKAWAGALASTPYKALRHVEKIALARGYRLTS